jgi:hypothetical protein
MYALVRNAWKYVDRDKRTDIIQQIEYDFLAPDTVNELFDSLVLIEKAIGKAYLLHESLDNELVSEQEYITIGKKLLEENNPIVNQLTILGENFENAKRPTVIIKSANAYYLFKELIAYYGSLELIKYIQNHSFENVASLANSLSAKFKRKEWINVGGQLIKKDDINSFKNDIKNEKLIGWDAVHNWYIEKGSEYAENRLKHALASLSEIENLNLKSLTSEKLEHILNNTIKTKEWITKEIFESRAKDYTNPFRTMVYDNEEEMNQVIGKLADNGFINSQTASLEMFKQELKAIKQRFQIIKEETSLN